MAAIRSRLVIGGSGELVLDELWDPAIDAFRNDATVTASLFDPIGDPVLGFQDVAMTYVPGSNGRYRVVVPVSATETFERGDVLEAEVIATTPAGQEMPFRSRIRMMDSGIPRNE
jgi:hypothetical protein